jgi:hypothetical protein
MDRKTALEKTLPVYRRLKDYRTVIAGDLRRNAQEVSSAVIVTQAPPYRVHEILAGLKPKSTAKLPQTCRVVIDGFNVSVVSTTPEAWGATLIVYTGPWAFRSCLSSDARLLRMHLKANGLWLQKERIAGREERQIFDVLGVPFMRPQDRRQFMSEARWQRRLKVRDKAPSERRTIWLAIDTTIRSRKKGNLPAKREELVTLTELDVHAIEIALQWLARHKLIISDGPRRWRVKPKLHVDNVCWTHGGLLNKGGCEVCKRNKREHSKTPVASI